MEGLNNLQSATVQTLLEECTSVNVNVKVKCLFLYLTDKSGQEWLSYSNLDKVNLGCVKRTIVSDGGYVSKYQITVSVPRELKAAWMAFTQNR